MAAVRTLISVVAALACAAVTVVDGAQVGVNYGLMGPYGRSTLENVQSLRDAGVFVLRAYKVDYAWLSVVRAVYGDTGAAVTVGIENAELYSAVNDAAFRGRLVDTLREFSGLIQFITVGNEPFHGANRNSVGLVIVEAFESVAALLRDNGLGVRPTMSFSASCLVDTYPPQNARFNQEIEAPMRRLITGLQASGSVFGINLYPFFAQLYDANVNVELARDGAILSAEIDATRAALASVGAGSLTLAVTETGWPTAGDAGASVSNAQLYTASVLREASTNPHITAVYLFEALDEPSKVGGPIDTNWGLMTANGEAKFALQF
mmetsp:Transcript_5053/g.15146  ORF Transcript_5053/g.15146 Transcript_5053/m.15146 type:complete len:321 (+) Transcript_5053:545-1507(+)|eukprot:CAMPEP_0198737514 /NCGR_PEP_ID=MMETSP1475-20131203/67908_1 /TAXON_ID= ORGANISM="Unidentified sp., Strain CCMP1999" /NCGR_SAMPLE_ID=MMETSP1475 /ASSEMBLY_ACC=CAM_ASM_001111 /LENGTH=320 /DNA_ID=CAMNT_0044501381 /DNA_START=1461 /DNA_END=2423 /DNA_ORIENTATION=-